MNQMLDTPVLQRQGSVHKCPSCGASLGAFLSVCGSCGHELLDVDANRSITSLASRFDEIEREVEGMGYKGKRREAAITEKKGRVIRDFPVPNSREDLQQLLYYIQPKIVPSVSPDPNIEDWRTKFIEVINRARNAYKNDDSTLRELAQMEASIDASLSKNLHIKAKRNPLFFAVLGLAAILGVAGLVNHYLEQGKLDQCEQAYTQAAAGEQGRLEKLVSAIGQDLGAKDLAAANAKLNQVHWQLDPSCKTQENARARASWQERAEQLTQSVKDTAAQEGAAREAQANRQFQEQQAAADRDTAERNAREAKVAELARIQAEEKHAAAARAAGEKRKASLEQQW